MPWDQKERVIREKRTIEATKKNLMGPSGKLGVIVRRLGSPILRQGSGLWDANLLEDPYDDFVEEEYEKTASEQRGPLAWRDEIISGEDECVFPEGYVFDGLSRGMHLEIIYNSANHKLTVTYKGYLVFNEVAGELDVYAPFDEWESMIDRLYTAAKKKEKQSKAQIDAERSEKVREKKESFWQRLRMRWGL